MGLCGSRPSNAPCFVGLFCTKVAESMHIYAVFPPRQQKVCSYLHLYVLFCLVFLSFGAGPMGIWPLPSAVPQAAGHVFCGHFCIKTSNAPVFDLFLHQGRRKYAYLWDFVQAGFPMPPVLSYFVRQDNRKYAYLWDFVEAGLRMPSVLWDFSQQGNKSYAY